SVAPNGPSGCDPADILALPGTTGNSCNPNVPGSPDVFIRCATLTFTESCTPSGGAGPSTNDDLTSLNFGRDVLGGQTTVFFSVDHSSVGCPGTGVQTHASAGHPEGDEFASVPSGSSTSCSGSNSVFLPAPAL